MPVVESLSPWAPKGVLQKTSRRDDSAIQAKLEDRDVKYGIDFRFLAKDATAPTDNTHAVDVEVDDTQFALIPAVGDYVDIPGDDPGMRNVPLRGKVRSKLFHYRLGYCYVTIVVEDCEEDWAQIGKV